MSLLLLCAFTAVPGSNLLLNPGFEQWEDDSSPSGWVVEDRSRTSVSRVDDSCHTGASGARLVRRELGSGNNSGLIQRVAVQAGVEYLVSCWCRDDVPEMSAGLGVSWRRVDSSYISASGVTNSVDSAGWQMLGDTVVAPAEAAFADFRLRCYAPAGMAHENRVLVDDALLGPLAATPETVGVWFGRDSLGLRMGEFIAGATSSLDFCCYNSTRTDIVQELLDAHARGVGVRVITDDRRLGNSWVAQLRGAGIPVWTDSGSSHSTNDMHNKFIVRDLADGDSANDWVWTGSYNPNLGELRADNGIAIPHTGLARAYRSEFEQMWGGSGPLPDAENARFHTQKVDVLATHDFELNGSPVELYFAPQDRVMDTITERARGTARHLIFGVFSFTWDDLGDAMIALWNQGKWVGGVLDNSGVNGTGSEFPRLQAAGVPIFVDSVPFGERIIHEKLMVIDSTTVIAGSANWSNNANQYNDENTVIIHDPGLAARYLAELWERFSEAGGPGVGERPAAPLRPVGRLVSPTADLSRLPPGARLYDATGRSVFNRSSLAPGIYFVQLAGARASPVVYLR